MADANNPYNLWDIPAPPGAPQMPSASGLFEGLGFGIGNWNIPQFGETPTYELPSGMGLTPTQGWWDTMAEPLRQGVMEPLHEASRHLTERFGGQGMGGSPRGGASGALAAATGQLYGQGVPGAMREAWGMYYPGQALQYGAGVGRERDIWGETATRERQIQSQAAQRAQSVWAANVAQNQWKANLGAQGRIMDYGSENQRRYADYDAGLAQWNMEQYRNKYPYDIAAGLTPGTYPSVIARENPGPLDFFGTLGGLGLGAAGLFTGNPIAGLAGAGANAGLGAGIF